MEESHRPESQKDRDLLRTARGPFFALLLSCVLLPGCLASNPGVVHETPELRIVSVGVAAANVFVVSRSGKQLMIDAGNPGDEAQIEEHMRVQGIDPGAIDYLILTHGHGDHGGTAAYFQRVHGMKVIGGEGDRAMIQNGGRAEVCPTSLLARAVLWSLRGVSYPPFELDVPISGDYDLAALGVEGRILHWPGHTDGSLVVTFDDRVFVGDLIRGGILSAETPTTHFFMCDLDHNREQIRRLTEKTDLGTWYPGHFGPFPRAAVQGYLGD